MKKLTRVISLVAFFLLIATQSWATVTYSLSELTTPFAIGGYSKMAMGKLTLAGTYATNGFTFTPSSVGMSSVQSVSVEADSGYVSYYDSSSGKVALYRSPSGSGTFTGTPATITPSVGNATIALTSGTGGTAVYWNTDHFETSGGGSFSLTSGTVTGAAYTPAGSVAISQAALAEVTAGVTLTGKKVTFLVIGQ